MPTRRALLASALAAAIRPPPVGAQPSPASGPGVAAAPTTILQLQRRTIEVNGKPASVFGIRQPDGTAGIITEVGKRFRVRVENHIDQPSLIHWHGLTPPWQHRMACPASPDHRSRRAAARITTSRCALAARSGCTPIKDCRSSR